MGVPDQGEWKGNEQVGNHKLIPVCFFSFEDECTKCCEGCTSWSS